MRYLIKKIICFCITLNVILKSSNTEYRLYDLLHRSPSLKNETYRLLDCTILRLQDVKYKNVSLRALCEDIRKNHFYKISIEGKNKNNIDTIKDYILNLFYTLHPIYEYYPLESFQRMGKQFLGKQARPEKEYVYDKCWLDVRSDIKAENENIQKLTHEYNGLNQCLVLSSESIEDIKKKITNIRNNIMIEGVLNEEYEKSRLNYYLKEGNWKKLLDLYEQLNKNEYKDFIAKKIIESMGEEKNQLVFSLLFDKFEKNKVNFYKEISYLLTDLIEKACVLAIECKSNNIEVICKAFAREIYDENKFISIVWDENIFVEGVLLCFVKHINIIKDLCDCTLLNQIVFLKNSIEQNKIELADTESLLELCRDREGILIEEDEIYQYSICENNVEQLKYNIRLDEQELLLCSNNFKKQIFLSILDCIDRCMYEIEKNKELNPTLDINHIRVFREICEKNNISKKELTKYGIIINPEIAPVFLCDHFIDKKQEKMNIEKDRVGGSLQSEDIIVERSSQGGIKNEFDINLPKEDIRNNEYKKNSNQYYKVLDKVLDIVSDYLLHLIF